MAYQTGVASSPSDLLTKLATFAGANGWTVNTPASGRVFVNGDIYVGAYGDDVAGQIQTCGALGYAGGAAWNAQTNSAAWHTRATLSAGPFTSYHFFAGTEDGSPYLHSVVEVTAGRYGHFSFGRLVKSGPFTGGTYCESVFWNELPQYIDNANSSDHQVLGCSIGNVSNVSLRNHFWADVDGLSNNWVLMDSATQLSTASTRGTGSCRQNGLLNNQYSNASIASNRRTPLHPVYLFVNRPASLRSLAGRLPEVRHLHIGEIADGEVITIGADNWQVFPITKRGTQDNDFSSGNYGYAYKR